MVLKIEFNNIFKIELINVNNIFKIEYINILGWGDLRIVLVSEIDEVCGCIIIFFKSFIGVFDE